MPGRFNITGYKVFCYAGSEHSVIHLHYGNEGETGFRKGSLHFWPDGQTLASARENYGHIRLNYRQNQFHAILEMLRTEKPVSLWYVNSDNAGIGTHALEAEPVGEGEVTPPASGEDDIDWLPW